MADEEKKEDQTEDESSESEEGEGEGKASGGLKGLGRKKLLIIIVIAVLVVASAGAGAFFLLAMKSEPEISAEQQAAAEIAAQQPLKTAYYPLDEILVDLVSPGNTSRLMRLKLNIELKRETDVPRFEQVVPRVIDDLNVFLRQLRVDDMKGSAGVFMLKENLLNRVMQAAEPVEIKDVLLQEVVIQ